MTTNEEADRTITIARTIEAPRRFVFEAFTSAEHLDRWWGPSGFRTTTRAFELREGGVWDFTMLGPDGKVWPNVIEWQVVVPPERLEYVHGEHLGDPAAFRSTMTFDERGPSRTEVTLRVVFGTKEERDEKAERYGAIEGGKQTLGRLAKLVESLHAKR